MSTTGIIGQSSEPIVRGNMTPPRGAVPTGEIHNGTQVVYRMKVKQYKRVVARDEDGEILYHHGPSGEKRKPQYMLAEAEPKEVEFVIDDIGNGMTHKNFHFRPAPGELEKKEREARRAAGFERLAEAMDANGLTFDELVSALTLLRDNPLPSVENAEVVVETEEERKAREKRERAANARAAKDNLKDQPE